MRIFATHYALQTMIEPIKIIQTKAFARQDGTILGIAWVVGFLCTMHAGISHIFATISNLLTLSTPFIVAFRLRSFRDNATDGIISYRRALFYCILTFFYATLLLTAVQFIWFKWFDGGNFANTQVIPTYEMMFKAYQIPKNEKEYILETISHMTPAAWSSFFMMTEMTIGIIISFPIAAIMKKN